jgi:hypothetical protein
LGEGWVGMDVAMVDVVERLAMADDVHERW